MKFRYSSYEVDPSPAIADGILYRPEIVIDVIGSRDRASIQALVDTGSDETVFPMSLARAIGVEVDRESVGKASAVGGHEIDLLPGAVTLQVAQDGQVWRWRAVVEFLDVREPENEVALLGYAGFLEYFRATFDSENLELELDSNSRLPREPIIHD